MFPWQTTAHTTSPIHSRQPAVAHKHGKYLQAMQTTNGQQLTAHGASQTAAATTSAVPQKPVTSAVKTVAVVAREVTGEVQAGEGALVVGEEVVIAAHIL